MPPIDGIGKAPTAMLPVGGVGGPKGTPAAPFESARVDAPAAVDDVAPPSSLERLEKGGIDLPQYIDASVDEATHHLEGLGKQEIGHIRAHLRSATASDPGLVEIVRQASGQPPEGS